MYAIDNVYLLKVWLEMKCILILFLSIITFSGLAQSCKLEIDKVDPRSNLRIVRTEYEHLVRVNNNPFLIKAQAVGDQKFLKIKYYNYNGFEIKSGSNIEFILLNNEIVSLDPYTNNGDEQEKEENGNIVVSTLLIFPLDATEYDKLVNNNISKLRFFIEEGYINKEIKDKKQGTLRSVLRCIK